MSPFQALHLPPPISRALKGSASDPKVLSDFLLLFGFLGTGILRKILLRGPCSTSPIRPRKHSVRIFSPQMHDHRFHDLARSRQSAQTRHIVASQTHKYVRMQ